MFIGKSDTLVPKFSVYHADSFNSKAETLIIILVFF